jgi:hypothetical protein
VVQEEHADRKEQKKRADEQPEVQMKISCPAIEHRLIRHHRQKRSFDFLVSTKLLQPAFIGTVAPGRSRSTGASALFRIQHSRRFYIARATKLLIDPDRARGESSRG